MYVHGDQSQSSAVAEKAFSIAQFKDHGDMEGNWVRNWVSIASPWLNWGNLIGPKIIKLKPDLCICAPQYSVVALGGF